MNNQPNWVAPQQPLTPSNKVIVGGDSTTPNRFQKWWSIVRSFIWPATASMQRRIITVAIAAGILLGGASFAIMLMSNFDEAGPVKDSNGQQVSTPESNGGINGSEDSGKEDENVDVDNTDNTGSGGEGLGAGGSLGGSSNSGSGSGSGNGGDNGSGNNNGNGGNNGGSGERSCPAYPAVPDTSCTGVPPGTQLTVHNGNLFATTEGMVIEGREVNGCIIIQANNVTIRKTRVNGWCFTGAISTGQFGEWSGTLIEDVEVNGTAPSDPNIAGAACVGVENYTARRLYVHHCGRAFNLGNNVTVEDSYMIQMYGAGTSHNSGIGSNAGLNITVRHNNIICDLGAPGNISTGGGCSGALVLYSDFGPVSATIEHNRFNSTGGYCTLAYAHTTGSSLTYRNNQFGVTYNSECSEFGPVSRITVDAPFIWENNVWYAPGQSKHGQQIPEPPTGTP